MPPTPRPVSKKNEDGSDAVIPGGEDQDPSISSSNQVESKTSSVSVGAAAGGAVGAAFVAAAAGFLLYKRKNRKTAPQSVALA